METMIPITKKSSYKLEVWHCDVNSRFVNMTLTFCSEYGCSEYDFRLDTTIDLVEISCNDFKYHTAFKNKRFKLIAQCLYMSQTKLIDKLRTKAQMELSYELLPF